MLVRFFWDPFPGGTVEYIGQRGVTPEEFEEIYRNDRLVTEPSTSTGHLGRLTKAGRTSTDKWVRIVWEEVEDEEHGELIILPVTVFFPEDPLE